MIDVLLREINDSLYRRCEDSYGAYVLNLHRGIFPRYGWVSRVNDELWWECIND